MIALMPCGPVRPARIIGVLLIPITRLYGLSMIPMYTRPKPPARPRNVLREPQVVEVPVPSPPAPCSICQMVDRPPPSDSLPRKPMKNTPGLLTLLVRARSNALAPVPRSPFSVKNSICRLP